MSTIDKCCEISKDLEHVFALIKQNSTTPFEKKKGKPSITEHDRKKILKLFNYDKW